MKPLAIFLLLCSFADAQQWYSVTPTQCGGCCPGGSCPIPQYYPPRTLPTRPQRPQPDGEFTQPAPQFQPLPAPPQPTTPPIPPQTQQQPTPAFDWTEYDKRQAKLLKAIAANKCQCKPCDCKPTDLTPVIEKLDVLIAASSKTPPAPTPAPTQPSEQHVVVVADHQGPYWERLAQTLATTRKVYAGIQDTTPPPFEVGLLPKAVVYRNNVPVRIVTGEHDVENLLYRLSRGEPI